MLNTTLLDPSGGVNCDGTGNCKWDNVIDQSPKDYDEGSSR